MSDFPIPAGVYAQTVTHVEHFTDRLFMFRITRPAAFRFRSGEFVMIGLPNAEKPVFRAYSIASPSWDEEIEFFSIKVENGPLTEHLSKIKTGDTVLMRKKATGTLVVDALTPAKRLWMLSTGTGIAPFASLIREPEVYEKFDEVILCHTTRDRAELDYGYKIIADAKVDMLVGEAATISLRHVATTTRETSELMGRITDRMRSGAMFDALAVPPLDPSTDRVMICGSKAMLQDLKEICEEAGLEEGSNARPADFVIERAFVD